MTPAAVFPQLLNMSLTASVVILLLLLLRLPLKKAPKALSYALWGLVLFRLLCPVSLPSAISLFSLADAPAVEAGQTMTAISYLPTVYPSPASAQPAKSEPYEAAPVEPAASSSTAPDVETIAAWIWLAGVLGMAAWGIAAYLRLLRQLTTAMPLEPGVYLAEGISTPFVLGLLRPKIYLPTDLQASERQYILLHERLHIRRLDHLARLIAYGALCLHWFNPLVWAAYVLSGRDMEMACDEAVIKKLGRDIRADYAASILALATGGKLAMPLAFGAGDPKGRIRNLAKWKRPAFWGVLAAVVLCAVLAVCLLTNPAPQTQLPAASSPAAQMWFDEYGSDAFSWSGIREINLDAFPGVTFRWLQNQVSAVTGEEITPLYSGATIWSVYFADLTGDGLPELCSTVRGSEMADTSVILYDYAAGASYALEDRGEYDYVLSLEDGKLWVTQYAYNTKTVVSRGYLCFENGVLSLKAQSLETGLAPGTYVPYQCIYMTPASSYYPFGGDSGFIYEVGANSFTAVYRGGSQVEIGDAHPALDTADERPSSALTGIRWNWQPFPYTDEAWADLYLFGLAPERFTQQHQEILYQPLSALQFLLRVDGDLWLVELQNDGQRIFLWSIYTLAPAATMGIAQWEYAPALTSRSPYFPLILPGEGTVVSCQGGSMVEHEDGLGWSPVEADGLLAETGILQFTVVLGGENYEGTLYFTGTGGINDRQVYTAALTGTGLTLAPNGMGEGGVIALAGGIQPVFWANFAGNTSFSQKLMLTERAPCWQITVSNTGSKAILMELEGAVYRIEAHTEKTIASDGPWEPGTYSVSFASAGVEGMEGEVQAVRTAAPGMSIATPYDLKEGSLTCSVEELSNYVFFTNTTNLAVTIPGGTGDLTLLDISQGSTEILYGHLDGKTSTCTFSNLTASRRYQLAWVGTADVTVTVSDGS